MLGHLGETLPFLLWRFDSRAKLYGVKLAKPPSRIHQAQYRGDDVGHVLGRAAQLHARRARPGPRDVRRRLSVRVGAGGGRVPRPRRRWRSRCGRTSPSATPRDISACPSRIAHSVHDQSPHRRRSRRNVSRPAARKISRVAIHAVPQREGGERRSLRHRRHDHVRHRGAGFHARRRAAAAMDPIAGDRRRSFPALPVAQAGRADHQRPRHSRPADARAGRLYDDGGQPRRGAAGRRPEGAFLGAAAVEHAARQDRGDRRHRRRRQRHRRIAQGAGHARHRRHPHAARGRGLRRDDRDRSAGRGGAPRRLPHQHAAGERRQYRHLRRRDLRAP